MADVKFSQYADEWETHVLSLKSRASQLTMRSHLKLLRKLVGDKWVADLDHKEIQKLVSELNKAFSAKSVRNIYGTLRNVLGEAFREGRLDKLPQPRMPKGRSHKDVLSLWDMQKLVAEAEEPYKTFYAVLSETGIRIGEALGLQMQDIDVDQKTLTINRSVYAGKPQEMPKTIESLRTLCISSPLLAYLSVHHIPNVPEMYIFRTSKCTPWWPSEVLEKQLQPLQKRLKMKTTGFHAFRHGARQVMRMAGVSPEIAERRMGHKLPGVIGVYDCPLPFEDREAAEKVGALLFGAPTEQASEDGSGPDARTAPARSAP